MEKQSLFQRIGIKRSVESFLALLYPPLCFHCRDSLNDPSKPLCDPCLNLLELIDPLDRCCYCFAPVEAKDLKLCPTCRSRYPVYEKIASVFDYEGPAATLVRQMKYQNKPWLAEGLAAYLHYQFLLLQWPEPDLIVPAPICWAHWMERGYNQVELLAQSLAKRMGKQVYDCLGKESGTLSQAGKSRQQRRELSPEHFYLTKTRELKDRVILLIDDVITTGTTVEYCSEALMEGYPSKIYILTVCRGV